MLKTLHIFACFGLLAACNNEPDAPKPIANFYVDNAGCSADCWVYFFDQSKNAVAWEWDFGNGIFSANQHDSVTYANSGSYNVTLKIYNADNVADEITKQIQVN